MNASVDTGPSLSNPTRDWPVDRARKAWLTLRTLAGGSPAESSVSRFRFHIVCCAVMMREARSVFCGELRTRVSLIFCGSGAGAAIWDALRYPVPMRGPSELGGRRGATRHHISTGRLHQLPPLLALVEDMVRTLSMSKSVAGPMGYSSQCVTGSWTASDHDDVIPSGERPCRSAHEDLGRMAWRYDVSQSASNQELPGLDWCHKLTASPSVNIR